MPYGDGTGPLGFGPATGWGRGPCGRGLARRGMAQGRGWRRGYVYYSKEDEMSSLKEEKKLLEEELKAINSMLEDTEKK
ncbi:MAG: DUF5320 domain-containing protein [Elusimicrobia bacterium]|nr:DUF5320 domain-containing protein [Elusimicrobiota bacterium]